MVLVEMFTFAAGKCNARCGAFFLVNYEKIFFVVGLLGWLFCGG